MSRSPSVLVDELVGHYRRLEGVRKKWEVLYSNKVLPRYQIELAYTALYLDSVVSFERFIENLFVGYLSRRFRLPTGAHVRASIKSDAVARDVVLGGNSYVDWLPYDRYTLRRAKAFFRNGVPFSSLTKSDLKILQEVLTIRNAIAHKSKHALRMFEKDVVGELALVGRERTPAGYLRSAFRAAPVQTRYENLMFELSTISRKLV